MTKKQGFELTECGSFEDSIEPTQKVQIDLENYREMPVIREKQELLEVITNTIFIREKDLLGKLLTIVDATTENKERAKYIKDLVKDAVDVGCDNPHTKTIRGFIRASHLRN